MVNVIQIMVNPLAYSLIAAQFTKTLNSRKIINNLDKYEKFIG
jgi:hypothetical protein